MKGGAWPFLVGGAICQANPDNERDLSLLNSCHKLTIFGIFYGGIFESSFNWVLDYPLYGIFIFGVHGLWN